MGSSPIASIDPFGVLAQLGARHIRIVEATGSNPVYSSQTAEPGFLFPGSVFCTTDEPKSGVSRDPDDHLESRGMPSGTSGDRF